MFYYDNVVWQRQNRNIIWKGFYIHWEPHIPLKEKKKRKKKPEVTGDSCGGRAVCVYLRSSLGSIYSHLGGRGKILKLIIFLPPYFFLPLCLQAKVKTCPVSPVSHTESTSKAGKGEKREEREEKRSAQWFVAVYKICKGFYRQAGLTQSRSNLLTKAGQRAVCHHNEYRSTNNSHTFAFINNVEK